MVDTTTRRTTLFVVGITSFNSESIQCFFIIKPEKKSLRIEISHGYYFAVQVLMVKQIQDWVKSVSLEGVANDASKKPS